jgi:L-malate glycosyltransferase
MKILFIAPRYTGGIGGHANRVANKLRENGIEVDLMNVPHIPIKKLKNPTFLINSVIKSIFTKKKYDVVHAFNLPSAFAMKYINAEKKVLSIHGVYSEQIDLLHSNTISRIVKNNEIKIMKWADKLLTNSKNVQNAYKKKYDINFDYIYGPIDLKKFNDCSENTSKEQNQIVYIGRDSFEKGIDILKEIEPKIDGKIVYCTNFNWEKTMKILKSSKILVVPSRIDNIPNVIKEAFYLKIPVIASDIEGISEIIQHNKNGILITLEDKNKFVVAINNLLKDEKLAEKISNSAYDYLMKHFTWDVLFSKYLKFYKDLMDT